MTTEVSVEELPSGRVLCRAVELFIEREEAAGEPESNDLKAWRQYACAALSALISDPRSVGENHAVGAAEYANQMLALERANFSKKGG